MCAGKEGSEKRLTDHVSRVLPDACPLSSLSAASIMLDRVKNPYINEEAEVALALLRCTFRWKVGG